jgi:hypothetical protein
MLSTLVPFQMTRKIQKFQKFPPFLHFVYLNTFFVSLSLSLFRAVAAAVGGCVKPSLSLSRRAFHF